MAFNIFRITSIINHAALKFKNFKCKLRVTRLMSSKMWEKMVFNVEKRKNDVLKWIESKSIKVQKYLNSPIFLFRHSYRIGVPWKKFFSIKIRFWGFSRSQSTNHTLIFRSEASVPRYVNFKITTEMSTFTNTVFWMLRHVFGGLGGHRVRIWHSICQIRHIYQDCMGIMPEITFLKKINAHCGIRS